MVDEIDEPEKIIGGRKETDAASRTRMNDEGQRTAAHARADAAIETEAAGATRERGALKNPGDAGTQARDHDASRE